MANQTSGGAFQPGADINFTGAVDFTPAPTIRGSEVPVTTTATQTLTNKTLTSPTILAAIANLKITEYVNDGAIAVESGIAVLTKTSAGAYTLAAPSVAGQLLILVAGTSYAHVLGRRDGRAVQQGHDGGVHRFRRDSRRLERPLAGRLGSDRDDWRLTRSNHKETHAD